MSGQVIGVIAKWSVVFTTLDTGASEEIIAADRVDILNWRSVAIQVKVHEHTLANNAGSIVVRAIPATWTEEVPEMVFLDTTFPVDVVIDQFVSSPAYLVAPLVMAGTAGFGARCFGSLMRLVVVGNRTGAGTIGATISVELAAKDA